MADTKLSALTELAATPAVDDEIYIRDISEDPVNESKRITTANLLASAIPLTQKAAASGVASLGATTKVVEQPASISDHLDNTAGGTDAEVTKAPTSNVMYDHGALQTAHGAVSAATASKIVVRDADARAKFAAPAAAGDALIKGTALTITEMAPLTTGKIWQGVANIPTEVDAPAGGPAQSSQAALEAETNEDTYAPPDLIKHSPGVAKGYCRIAAAGTIVAGSYNVTSITDTGTGNRTIVWNVDFANANYSAVATLIFVSSYDRWTFVYTFANGSVQHIIKETGGTLVDEATSVCAYGDQ